MRQVYRTDGHRANYLRKVERNAVNAGRAAWIFARPAATMEVSPEIAEHSGPPVAPKRVPFTNSRTHARTRRFGEGLGARCPSYRLPGGVTTEDLCWWEQRNAEEEAREIRQMEERFLAQTRMDSGWDPY